MAEPFFGNTDTGRMRDNNEDAFIVQKSSNRRFVIGCVIDGVGGYEGGEVAAEIARETIREQLASPGNDPVSQMKQAIVLANQQIYEQRSTNTDKSQMACVLTLVLADYNENQFHYAHVGDTRLYLLRDHSLVKVTKDHSFVGFLEDNKRLSEQEAMLHPKRNEINKALGFDPNIGNLPDYIDTGTSPFLPGDLLMLCSDGLSDLVDAATITSLLSSSKTLSKKTEALIKAANDAGGKDNITVVLLHNNKARAEVEATRPVLIKKNEPPKEEAVKATVPATIPVRRKRNHTFTIILVLLCLLLGTALVLLWQRFREEEKKNISLPEQTTEVVARNAAEAKLIDSINSTGSLYLHDSLYTQTIVITDTITVNRDSLYVKGNGNILLGDSAYRGTGLVVSAGCQYLLLENLVFKNFDVGIFSEAKVLRLKNVRFENCRIPVQSGFHFPDNIFVNGTIKDSELFKRDSLPGK